MRVALVHYWLLGMRGGEKVLEALCRIFPDADIFTLFYDPDKVSPTIRCHRITASFLNPFRSCYRSLLPLMPLALEHFDLRGYDLIVSSESGPAKGIITSADSRHICYCHSPMRYLWDLYPDYLHEWTRSSVKRALIAAFSSHLRVWDYATSARVDKFLANSRNVKRRIWKVYRREAEVIYPPVAVDTFYSAPSLDYFLIVSELVSYKRVADAVISFSRTGHPLKVVGDGPEYKSLRKVAGPNIEFCGRVTAAELRHLYASCRAVVQPGEEDFGIVSVEALASGKPVIALGRGGVLETVLPETGGGFFYRNPGDWQLEKTVAQFEKHSSEIRPLRLQLAAQRFSEQSFSDAIRRMINASEYPSSEDRDVYKPMTRLNGTAVGSEPGFECRFSHIFYEDETTGTPV